MSVAARPGDTPFTRRLLATCFRRILEGEAAQGELWAQLTLADMDAEQPLARQTDPSTQAQLVLDARQKPS